MAFDLRRKGMGLAVIAPVLVVLAVTGPAAAQVIDAAPDLVLAGSSSTGGAVGPGERFSYDLLVTNRGDGWASDVSVLSRIPRGLRVVNLLPTMEGGRCSVAGVGTVLRFLVICERPALGPGGTAAIAIDVEVITAAFCLPLTMRATATAADEPPPVVNASNSVVLTDGTGCPAAVGIAVTGPRFAHLGDRIDLTFLVANRGPVDLSAVTLFDSACDTPPRRSHAGGNDEILPPGDTWRYACVATVAGSGRVRHAARVVMRDPAGARVTDRIWGVVRILTPAVRIDVRLSPRSSLPGSTIVRRYRVTNTGDAELVAIVVRDGERRVGTIHRLAPGATATLHRTTTLPSVGGRVIRIARVVGRDRLGLAVSDTARSVVRVVPPAPSEPDPGTAFTGRTQPSALGGMMAALGIVGFLCLWVARRRSGP